MTRINADLSPKVLLDQHLMAEYRELPMVYASLRRSLKSNSVEDVLQKIPEEFCLGKGHISFFYNKLAFLDLRYKALVAELKERGYELDSSRIYSMGQFPKEFKCGWRMNGQAKSTIVERILSKFKQKPNWYRYNGSRMDFSTYEQLLIS